MRAEGVTSRELIEHGLMMCRRSGYVRPVSAGQFCLWAWESAAKQAGIPTLDQVNNAILARLQNPNLKLKGVNYHVLTEMDWHNAKQSSRDKVLELVKVAYERTVRHWRAGKAFREPRQVKPEATLQVLPLDRQENKKRMTELLGTL